MLKRKKLTFTVSAIEIVEDIDTDCLQDRLDNGQTDVSDSDDSN